MAAGTFSMWILEVSCLNFQTFLVFCLAFLLSYLYFTRPRNLPPYPAGWRPVVGHLAALGRAPHVKLTEWRQQYGDVFTVRLGMEDVVVLNGYTAVKDALVDRSELFASRPPNYIFDVAADCGKDLATGRWGDACKKKRRFASKALETLGVKIGTGSIEGKIQEEGGRLCDKVAAYEGEPFSMEGDLYVALGNVICSIVSGYHFDYGDVTFTGLMQAVTSVCANIGSGQPLTFFPFLRFIPGLNRCINDATCGSKKIQKFVRDELARHRQDLDHINPRDFLDLGLIEVEKQENVGVLTEENVIFIVEDFFLAGIATPSNTLLWGLLYMVLNPDVQKKVQTEIDAVVGGNVPSLSHRPRMPYTEAAVMETQRIRTIVPLGLPHAATQQVKVGQFDIPDGTQVLMNLWSLHMDPAYWPDPDRFDPGRFLDAEGRVISNPDSFMPFSGGWRSCPGQHLAKMELFLTFTALLQKFTFKLPEGAPCPSTDGVLGITFLPHFYELCATPR